MHNRRDFIRQTCALCLGAAALGALLTEESCKPSAFFTTAPNAEKVQIPLKAIKGKNTLIVKNPAMENNILLVKKSESSYTALLMRCTHRGAALEIADDKLNCPAHGSMFDFDGKVLLSPASEPLIHYPVTIKGDQLQITLT